MANPTTAVQSMSKKVDDTKKYVQFPQAADVYVLQEMIGRRATDNNAYHFDDSSPMTFLGLFAEPTWKPTTDLPASGFQKPIWRHPEFSMPLYSGTASRITDIGKAVYAVNSGAVTLNPLITTNANLVGYVSDVYVSDPGTLTGSSVWITPVYFSGRDNYKGVLVAPATGGATYATEILNRVVEVPNTAAETITLPAVSTSAAGDRVIVIKTTSAAFAVTIAPNGTDTINGANASITLAGVQWARIELYSDGTQWIISTTTNSNNGLLVIPPGATAQAIATSGTITLPTGSSKLLSAAAASTGVILTPGVTDGQLLTLINTSGANSITFAASGTSNVALGTGAVIAANAKLILQWSATQSLWY